MPADVTVRLAKFQQEVEARLAAERTRKDQAEAAECTFTPRRVARVPDGLEGPSTPTQAAERLYEQRPRGGPEAARRREEMARWEHEMRDAEECTFEPQINELSRHMKPRYNRASVAYNTAAAAAPLDDECTFAPRINPPLRDLDVTNGKDVFERLQAPAPEPAPSVDAPDDGDADDTITPEQFSQTFLARQRARERARAVAAREQEPPEPSFTPRLDRRSLAMAEAADDSDFLARVAQDMDARRRRKQERERTHAPPFAPDTSRSAASLSAVRQTSAAVDVRRVMHAKLADLVAAHEAQQPPPAPATTPRRGRGSSRRSSRPRSAPPRRRPAPATPATPATPGRDEDGTLRPDDSYVARVEAAQRQARDRSLRLRTEERLTELSDSSTVGGTPRAGTPASGRGRSRAAQQARAAALSTPRPYQSRAKRPQSAPATARQRPPPNVGIDFTPAKVDPSVIHGFVARQAKFEQKRQAKVAKQREDLHKAAHTHKPKLNKHSRRLVREGGAHSKPFLDRVQDDLAGRQRARKAHARPAFSHKPAINKQSERILRDNQTPTLQQRLERMLGETAAEGARRRERSARGEHCDLPPPPPAEATFSPELSRGSRRIVAEGVDKRRERALKVFHERAQVRKSRSPGPGNYEVASATSTSPKYSFGGKGVDRRSYVSLDL